MKKATCTAIAENGRINLIIKKDDKDYQKFADILNAIEKNGIVSWYGDIVNQNNEEQSGLIIISKNDKGL